MARRARGLSYKQLASQLGVKKSTLENWENGKSAPRANRLNQLAGVLNVPLLWLIAGSDRAPSEFGPDSNETTGIEGRLMRAERLVQELSQILGELRSETRQVQQRIDDD
jgi:transcriptional regulator with XRE-family HTH domain